MAVPTSRPPDGTMSTDWNEFLRQQGAHRDGSAVEHFGNAAAERTAPRAGNVLVDLSHFALVRVAGSDARTFLNGQLTNDVGRLDDGRQPNGVQLSAWCSPKGRMLALFYVLRDRDGYLLQLPGSLRDDITRRLRMYVLRSKVELQNADDQYVRIGVAGAATPALLQAAIGAVPEEVNTLVRSDNFTVLRLPGAAPRFEILGAPGATERLWREIRCAAVPAGASAWTWHDIMAGIPGVLPATSDAFVPQMANLDLLGGVSFDKGCYTGQEIVARVHYRGRLKQRMYRAHVATPVAPQPGEPIYTSTAPTQSTGTVVLAAPSPEEGYDLLAVIHCDAAGTSELRLRSADGAPLTLKDLPYSLSS